jgi:hypothetical protein
VAAAQRQRSALLAKAATISDSKQQQQHQLAGVRRAHVRVLLTARSGAALERFLSQGSSAPESELPLGIHPVSHLSFDSHS